MTQATPQQTSSPPDCFGEFDGASDCTGGVDAFGRKFDPCPQRTSCRSISATEGVSSIHPASVSAPRPLTPSPTGPLQTSQGSPSRGSTSPHRLPVMASPPATSTAPQARPGASPAPLAAPPPPGVQVHYDAVAPHISSRLPRGEATHHSKKNRFVAETTRAGLAAMFGQAAHFIANTTFLPEDPGDG